MQNIQEFVDLGLSEKSIKAIQAKGFEVPTEIQKLCIPVLLRGQGDLIGQAQTGTGKTAAFALPILEKTVALSKEERRQGPKALVLVPTRELCIQVCEEIQSLALDEGVRVCAIYGGASYNVQFRDLKAGADIVVGTPGRILDHLERKTLDLSKIMVCVLDEADEMLDMGFIEDIEAILSQTNDKRQMLWFSATMPDPILRLADTFMTNYRVMRVQGREMTSSLTKQIFYEVFEEDKLEALRRTIDISPEFYALVFCRTKVQCEEVGQSLISMGYNAEVLHGDLSQTQREIIVHKMRSRVISILVATDVAARGIDIPELTHVINYSLPDDPEIYVHRVGRTGRAGKEGLAVTFITPKEFSKFLFYKEIAGSNVEKRRVPTIDEVVQTKKRALLDSLISIVTDAENGKCPDQMYAFAKLLAQEHHTTNIIAALINDKYNAAVDQSSYRPITDLFDRKEPSRETHNKSKLGYDRKGQLRKGERQSLRNTLTEGGRIMERNDKKSQYLQYSKRRKGKKKANISRFKN